MEPPVRIRGRGLTGAVAASIRSQPGVTKVVEDGDSGAIEIALSRDAEIGPLVRLAVTAGADIEGVVRESSSLEAAFLAVVEAPAPDNSAGAP